MELKNVKLLNDNFKFVNANLTFGEKIEQITPAENGILYVIPGFIDIHSHAAVGTDAMDSDVDLAKWTKYMRKNGVTTFFPGTVTGTDEELISACERLKDSDGINLEGPFLSPEKKGAHVESKIKPVDLKLLEKIKDSVKITTVAPEIPGNMEKIPEIVKMGIKVSVGHSAADYETAKKAFSLGATHVTHLYNTMNPYLHRDPGIIGAALENDNIFCEIISDGIHVHPSVVRNLYKTIGEDRMVLVSDAMRATGLSDGVYTLGGLEVFVKNSQARLSDGTLAGSAYNLYEMVLSAHSFGIPLEKCVKMATLTPARAVGIDNELGSISVSKYANLVVLDEKLKIVDVYYHGKKIDN